MLTTTLDGLWVIQILTGIEVVAPELGLRPHLPSLENKQSALAHPVALELRAQGVVDESGEVDTAVREWLTVLSRRDMALLVQLRRPGEIATSGALLARYDRWWAVIVRSAELIRIYGAGTATAEGPASMVLGSEIERLCGSRPPALLRPVTLDASAVRAAATSPDGLHKFLAKQHLDADQLRLLIWAIDERRTGQAAIVAIQNGAAADGPTRAHIDQGVVTIVDTPEGRLVVEHLTYAGTGWLIVGPGTTSAITSAVGRLVRRLPAKEEWYSHRKAV